jgi:Pyruvate/2-oxoacid:ferredoxin oxidoreductase delta subunit
VIIVSVGHTAADVEALAVPLVEAGADMLEIVSYRSQDMADAVRVARSAVELPVLAKVSANWPDLGQTVRNCLEAGANGITAIDSIGPALAVDIETRRPVLASPSGFAWLSGAPIKPVSIRVVAEVALQWPVPILGVGGVCNGRDAIEMMMAGASAVQAHTAPLLQGLSWFPRTLAQLDNWLDRHSLSSVKDIHRAALPSLRNAENSRPLAFLYDPSNCTFCQQCTIVCAYHARSLEGQVMALDRQRCRSCGLCASVCPTGALTIAGRGGNRST